MITARALLNWIWAGSKVRKAEMQTTVFLRSSICLALSGLVFGSQANAKATYVDPNAIHVPRPLSEIEVKQIEDAVKDRLNDPYSAVFDAPIGADKTKLRVVAFCVAVNAKNQFGAYSGKQMVYGVINDGKAAPVMLSDFLPSVERNRKITALNQAAEDRLRHARQEAALIGLTSYERGLQAIKDRYVEIRIAEARALKEEMTPEAEAAAAIAKACRDNVMRPFTIAVSQA